MTVSNSAYTLPENRTNLPSYCSEKFSLLMICFICRMWSFGWCGFDHVGNCHDSYSGQLFLSCPLLKNSSSHPPAPAGVVGTVIFPILDPSLPMMYLSKTSWLILDPSDSMMWSYSPPKTDSGFSTEYTSTNESHGNFIIICPTALLYTLF